VSFAEQLFSGWSGLVVIAPIAAAFSAAAAVPSWLWSRFSRTPDWVGMVMSTLIAGGLWLFIFGIPRALGLFRGDDLISFANIIVPTFFLMVAPQLAAYYATRDRLNWRPLAASGFVLLGAALWALPAMVLGVTPD
jgi:hypothetical protein